MYCFREEKKHTIHNISDYLPLTCTTKHMYHRILRRQINQKKKKIQSHGYKINDNTLQNDWRLTEIKFNIFFFNLLQDTVD